MDGNTHQIGEFPPKWIADPPKWLDHPPKLFHQLQT